MRRHDQPIDLLVAIIGEREHRPVSSGFARAHLDAADDAVGARRGRNLDAVAVGVLELDRVGEVDGGGVKADIDGLDGGSTAEIPSSAANARAASAVAARKNTKRRPPSSVPPAPTARDDREFPVNQLAGFTPN